MFERFRAGNYVETRVFVGEDSMVEIGLTGWNIAKFRGERVIASLAEQVWPRCLESPDQMAPAGADIQVPKRPITD